MVTRSGGQHARSKSSLTSSDQGKARLPAAASRTAGLDVRIGGGPATIRAFLAADVIDDLHLVVVPIVLGRGERLWDGLGALEARSRTEAVISPSGVTT